jgi:DNA segregation ATPase FtsK/SpoIIIE, S-DNA-T family
MALNPFNLSDGKFLGIPRERLKQILGAILFVIGVFFLLSVAFSRPDMVMFGSFGNAAKKFFIFFFGKIAAIILPLLLIYWSFRFLLSSKIENVLIKLTSIALSIISLCALLTLSFYNNPETREKSLWYGGLLGNFITSNGGLRLPRFIGFVGSAFLFSVILIPSMIIATDFFFYRYFKALYQWILSKRKEKKEEEKTSEPEPLLKKMEEEAEPEAEKEEISVPEKKKLPKRIFKKSEPNRVFTPDLVDEISKKIAEAAGDDIPDIAPDENGLITRANKSLRAYRLPPLSLLKDPPPSVNQISEEEIKEKSEVLEKTLADFGISAKVIQVTQGPVVTLFALQPASGVKINRIVSLENDLAMVLRAIKVRILAPIPGKGAVGIEVPNKTVEGVFLKEILTCRKMKKSTSPLAFCIGKTISGEPFLGDLAKMPHLLIAGATGSGKSVCLNALISSILFRQSPDKVKLIIIDPKRVEMTVYQAIPHLLAPVVCEPKKAASALEWAVEQMDDRYKLLAGIGVRNIDSFNSLVLSDKPQKKLMGKDVKYMPHIVIVVDELADLMLIARNEVEDYIIRLAQLARAVGIHLVIATQRPSVNVITGIIKANFPSRIAFQVSSKVDSRTILDMNGAEALLGKGDMLFSYAGSQKPVRLQGAFVSEEEVDNLTEFIREQEKAAYIKQDFESIDKKKAEQAKAEALEKAKTAKQSSSVQNSDEDLYTRALRMVLENRKASVSMIQRRLRIGYARAGRLMDIMEEKGIVGPYQGSKPRDLMVDPMKELAKLGGDTQSQLLDGQIENSENSGKE